MTYTLTTAEAEQLMTALDALSPGEGTHLHYRYLPLSRDEKDVCLGVQHSFNATDVTVELARVIARRSGNEADRRAEADDDYAHLAHIVHDLSQTEGTDLQADQQVTYYVGTVVDPWVTADAVTWSVQP